MTSLTHHPETPQTKSSLATIGEKIFGGTCAFVDDVEKKRGQLMMILGNCIEYRKTNDTSPEGYLCGMRFVWSDIKSFGMDFLDEFRNLLHNFHDKEEMTVQTPPLPAPTADQPLKVFEEPEKISA